MLRRSHKDRLAVDGFTVREGETYGLLGPNGAGRTATIPVIVGVLAGDAGEVRIDGSPHGASGTHTKALIGYVPQELAPYPGLTAGENLNSALGTRHSEATPRTHGVAAGLLKRYVVFPQTGAVSAYGETGVDI
ncbi:ATP-binding cassette domain-containing protein [Planomonospora sp. ID67723]|uniref:ATP-binding cassette domain-containing protein n=1 Tax=Planomonospora sp. ID67723 TaxID=2738134 RepID=UPI0027DB9849|nr:ATP-binding cassette domain-containing protein [Planomonospora sp. ID67723]